MRSNDLRIGFWNVNGLRNKLESNCVIQWMNCHDIVVLSETHRKSVSHAPGFIGYAASNPHNHRGGLAILFSQAIHADVVDLDTDVQEQIWFRLKSIARTQFCGLYISPSDSAYFSEESFAEVEARTLDQDHRYAIMGDMNTRCGLAVNDLVNGKESLLYSCKDIVQNDNGKKLIGICRSNSLLPLNNLRVSRTKCFEGGLTFRKRERWISEIDYCVVSPKIAQECVSSFTIIADLEEPICKLSDHAPVTVCFKFPVDPTLLAERARNLCQHVVPAISNEECKAPIKLKQIDVSCFKTRLDESEPPEIDLTDFDITLPLAEHLYNLSKECKKPRVKPAIVDPTKARWQRIVECRDSRTLWRAIDWKGAFNPSPQQERPGDAEFQRHMEELLNPAELGGDEWPVCDADMPFIPLLDDEFSIPELQKVIKEQMDPSKSAGPDGVSPGVFRLFPVQWLFYLCLILTTVFHSRLYPPSWCSAKLNMLHKKGSALLCDNYRGISIINSLSKLYDYILNNRLMTWHKPCREQAGAQPKRGCVEHLVTLRLVIEYARYKKVKLFVTYVDFSKAYDRVPRGKMFQVLKLLGCGAIMLAALMALYSRTTSILGAAIITATIGVRQGSPTSCFLFVLFVDVLIRRLKTCPDDGWLKWLHVLMLMDDTVIFATSRERMAEKLAVLDDYCREYGMVVNESKTKFMAFNGDDGDRLPFQLGNLSICHCDSYTYLGVIVTADGLAESSLKAHASDKLTQLNKLIIFLAVNHDAPFHIKKKVFDAAFSSAILYSCECWIKVPLRSIESLYNSALKALLGVRPTTCNDVCMIEAGVPAVSALVRSRQAKFFKEVFSTRSHLQDDPLMFALRLTEIGNKPMYKRIMEVRDSRDHFSVDLAVRQNAIRQKNGSKYATYVNLNPNLETPSLYTSQHPFPDNLRISFTRFRTSSHRLRVELGRWCRTPREQRTCGCGSGAIQDEAHVFECVHTRAVRNAAGFNEGDGFVKLFANPDVKNLKMLKECLRILEEA